MMKKIFIEPELKRIELNLNENIASSHEEGYNDIHNGAFNVCHAEKGCLDHVHKTDISYDQIIVDICEMDNLMDLYVNHFLLLQNVSEVLLNFLLFQQLL